MKKFISLVNSLVQEEDDEEKKYSTGEARVKYERAKLARQYFQNIEEKYKSSLIASDEPLEKHDPIAYNKTLKERFAKIYGNEKVKEELITRIIFPLTMPNLYKRLQVTDSDEPPDNYPGVLLVGRPGTGKTELAKITAELCKRELIMIDTDILDKYVGESEKNIEELFQKAIKTHAILFLDEVDALARDTTSDSSDSRASLRSKLLREFNRFMDAVKDGECKGAVVSASNYPDQIGIAFSRRLGKMVETELPSDETRTTYFEHLKTRIPKILDIEFPQDLVRITDGWDFQQLKKFDAEIRSLHLRRMVKPNSILIKINTKTNEKEIKIVDSNDNSKDDNCNSNNDEFQIIHSCLSEIPSIPDIDRDGDPRLKIKVNPDVVHEIVSTITNPNL